MVKVPPGLRPVGVQKQDALKLGRAILREHPEIGCWAVGGHSLGAAIAAQFVHEEPDAFAGLILIGTTHPRDFDLSGFAGDVTKLVGTNDRVAPRTKVGQNKALLPKSTHWVVIEGGNHAQFGHYGP